MSATTRIGIGGWTYPPWRQNFYPDGLAQSRELAFAARAFGAIEINATFYGRQSTKSWEAWAAAVPDGFQFSVKGSRYCVSRSRLADAGDGVEAFLAQGLRRLGPKLGPILWMLAARRTFEHDDIARFLDLLPTELDGLPLRHAVEPRHESFRDEAFATVCRERNVAVVFSDHGDFPCIDMDTADFRYARLQRMREDCATGYAEAELAAFADRTENWHAAGQHSYVFMINGAKVRAPAAAMALQQRLGISRGFSHV